MKFDSFCDEMVKIAGITGAATKMLKGVLTKDPRAAWRTGSHAMRRSQRLAKADVLRAGRGAKETGSIEKLLAEGKINKERAAEMMKHHQPSSPVRQLPRVEGTQVTRSIRGPAPRAERTVSAPPRAAAPQQRGGVVERVRGWYGGLTPGRQRALQMGGAGLAAGGAGYGLG